MKKLTVFLSFVILCLTLSLFSFKEEKETIQLQYVSMFQNQIKDFLKDYDALYLYVKNEKIISKDRLKDLFLTTRYSYKKAEMILEYFAPSTAGMLNMALVPQVDEYDPNQLTIEPEGLQKVEELIYTYTGDIERDILLQELKRTRGAILRAQQITQSFEPLNYQIFEAFKQEIIRIWAFNLTGIDATYSKNSIKESYFALQALKEVTVILNSSAKQKKLKKELLDLNLLIANAQNYFLQNSNFDSLNRMFFLKEFANPIYSSATRIEQLMNVEKSPIVSMLFADANSIFNSSAWNLSYFSSTKEISINKDQIALGKMLFFDPVLSGNNQRACASCHRPEYAFTEPLPKSQVFGQQGSVDRNAPTLLNVGFQKGLFHDARVFYLEDQVVAVNQNELEMHGNFNQTAQKLKSSNEYVVLFKKAFAGTADTIINKNAIIRAIASYERTLVSMNSRFDQYMRNEKVNYTQQEINGFNLFMGKAQCGNCHFAPLFNGTVPPKFDDTEWEIIGVPSTKDNKALDLDEGRFKAAKMEIHKYAFKTPSLRNIEFTAPYMHNGVYDNLDEVMEFYNNGGGIGHGYEVPNQTLPSDSLKLSKIEMEEVISFMKSLSDTVNLTSKPSYLPVIYMNGLEIKRKIGGLY